MILLYLCRKGRIKIMHNVKQENNKAFVPVASKAYFKYDEGTTRDCESKPVSVNEKLRSLKKSIGGVRKEELRLSSKLMLYSVRCRENLFMQKYGKYAALMLALILPLFFLAMFLYSISAYFCFFCHGASFLAISIFSVGYFLNTDKYEDRLKKCETKYNDSLLKREELEEQITNILSEREKYTKKLNELKAKYREL